MVKYIKASFDNSNAAKQEFIDYCRGRVADLGTIEVYYSPYFDLGDDYDEVDGWEDLGEFNIALEYPKTRIYRYEVVGDYDIALTDKNGYTDALDPIGYYVLDDIVNRKFIKIDTTFYNYCIDNWENLDSLL